MPIRLIFLPDAAGGGTTISCSVGNASADGNTASVNRSISASVGNAVADGKLASLPLTITCIPGNAVADGRTASLPVTISTTVGNAVAAGLTASIEVGGAVTIDCTVGNAVADGSQASISRTITTTVGNATAAGLTATVTVVNTINCTVGNAVADGLTASIGASVLIGCSIGNAIAKGKDAKIIITPKDDRGLFMVGWGRREPTKEETRKHRQKLGIIPPDVEEIIQEVADEVISAPEPKSQNWADKRLKSLLKQAQIVYRNEYLAELHEARKQAIQEEIDRRIAIRIELEDREAIDFLLSVM